jgi:hypothetical protein
VVPPLILVSLMERRESLLTRAQASERVSKKERLLRDRSWHECGYWPTTKFINGRIDEHARTHE